MNHILEKLAFWVLKFYLFWLNWIEWKTWTNSRADPACLFHSWLTACINYGILVDLYTHPSQHLFTRS